MRTVQLTIALSSYDHALPITSGEVPIAGTTPNFIELPIPEMFRRFVKFREWDVSEVSLVKYSMLRAAGDDAIVALPVFTSRVFRQSSIFVRGDRIAGPAQLRGAKLGIPEWTNSAGVWARGLLADMYGIQLADIEWVQGGIDRPSRPAVLDAPTLSQGIKMSRVEDRSLEEMVWAGDLDGMIAPNTPQSLRQSAESGGLVRRLFADPLAEERAYFEKVRCFPIMHTLAIRKEVLDRFPWLATNIFRAFEVAKRRYFSTASEISASRVPVPWVTEYLEEAKQLFGEDLWPYGVEANRPTLEVFLRYGTEQGLFPRTPTIEELFADIEPFVDGMV